MLYVGSTILVLGVLILVHELGHFVLAKLSGVGVERFSIGFGARVWGVTIGETEYRLSAFPLGGYVKMVGENPDEEEAVTDPSRSFTHKPVATRIGVVLAGPLSNLLLAVVIFAAVFTLGVPVPVEDAVVGRLKDGYPAVEAGLQSGDTILAIDGREIADWVMMAEIIHNSPGTSLQLTIDRHGERLDLVVTPRGEAIEDPLGEDSRTYGLIGIEPATVIERYPFMEATGMAFQRTYEVVGLTVVVIGKLFTREISTKTLGGPLMIGEMAGESAKQGAMNLFAFMAFLSIQLGVFNLLPIPILDGGHLLFYLVEAVRGKPLSIRKREIAQQVGLGIIVVIFLFIFYNDIMRLGTRVLTK